MLGWKTARNNTINLKYPDDDKKDGKNLTFIMAIVYQVNKFRAIQIVCCVYAAIRRTRRTYWLM